MNLNNTTTLKLKLLHWVQLTTQYGQAFFQEAEKLILGENKGWHPISKQNSKSTRDKVFKNLVLSLSSNLNDNSREVIQLEISSPKSQLNPDLPSPLFDKVISIPSFEFIDKVKAMLINKEVLYSSSNS